ncbi:MAG: putative 17 beta-hydroxysteroid dehydrogenase type 3, partial [Streblomastix strix]
MMPIIQYVASALHEINSQVRVITIKANLSDDPEKVTQQIIQQLEGLDISILYFNAGFGAYELAASPTENTLLQFRSNIITHQYLFQALYPKLANRQMNGIRRGAVLFTSSVGAYFGAPGAIVYSATKAYLGHLGECLATEAEYFGIDVLSLYPAGVNSGFAERIKNVKFPKAVEKYGQKPDNVADLALRGLGRVTRVDSGFQAIIIRIVTKLIDANVMI